MVRQQQSVLQNKINELALERVDRSSSVVCGIQPPTTSGGAVVRGDKVVLEGAGVLGGASIFWGVLHILRTTSIKLIC